uniref:J domain-containing protein n=1 Tax=Acrobeloides nanus TaxID=290746 RepID=A0A914C550_9BILA
MAEWRDEVINRIVTLYQDDLNKLSLVLSHLTKEEQVSGEYKNSAFWKMLHSLRNSSDEVFKKYINDETYIDVNFYRKMMVDIHNCTTVNKQDNGIDKYVTMEHRSLMAANYTTFNLAWMRLPLAMQEKFLALIPAFIQNNPVGGGIISTALQISKFSTPARTTAVLAAVYLSFEALHSIYLWWKGEISGKRVAKNIIDCTATVGAGIGGGVVGGIIGSLAGPVGTFCGTLIGGAVSSIAANALVDKLTLELFDLPKDVAVENAYSFLGLSKSASSDAINAAYKKLCLKYHPDKGGNPEDFTKLQSCMAIIKVSHGEKY